MRPKAKTDTNQALLDRLDSIRSILAASTGPHVNHGLQVWNELNAMVTNVLDEADYRPDLD
jgi:hypothetical protein